MGFLIQFLKDQLQANPSRVAGYVSSVALAGALQLGRLAGVDIPSDVQAGIILISGFLTTELIRRFVFSPKTVQAKVDEAAATGNTDIGSPPKGE